MIFTFSKEKILSDEARDIISQFAFSMRRLSSGSTVEERLQRVKELICTYPFLLEVNDTQLESIESSESDVRIYRAKASDHLSAK